VRAGRGGAGERGQATTEWIALVLLVSLLLAGLLAATAARVLTTDLTRAIAARLVCAARLFDACSEPSELVAAYGPELAAAVEESAPEIAYEAGMSELPVDFRSCRGGRCGHGPQAGRVWSSDTGEPAVAFVHVVDCRTAEAREAGERRGYDCSGGRAGSLYVQYWLYYGDSATAPWSDLPGRPGFHRDDWESYQVRIGENESEARASSHHSYAYRGGLVNWLSDAGVITKAAWGEATGRLYVSSGSHAGHVYEPPRLDVARGMRTPGRVGALATAATGGQSSLLPRHRLGVRFVSRRRPARWTPAGRLRLIPIEGLGAAPRRARFAVVPPWRKPVYRDPEEEGT
jgi:hypothetical protein